ncbi:polycystin family receptor for egg jelly-like isoform X2 [Argopecten irradians]|uniref:polycystin family receptor for egg jelly-like isoform X2 n=1 Tax=Argopecten irradians TaxID=31199 RepID=UPI00371BAEFE
MAFSPNYLFWITSLIVCLETSTAEDVAGFEMAVGGTNLITLAAGQTATIDLVYTAGGTALTLTGTYDTSDVVTGGGTVDTGTKTGQLQIDSGNSAHVPSDFGTYLLTLTLTPSSGAAQDKQVVIFYEQAIAGFQVTVVSDVVAIGEPFDFAVAFTSGSNIELEWFLDENSTCLEEYTGVITSASRNHNFSTAGTHNITVVAANNVGRTHTNIIITAQMRIGANDFTVTNNEGPVQTSENVVFTVTLDSSISSPDYGNIHMEINYNDGSTPTNESISGYLATMQGAGHTFNKAFTTQGNYTVNIRIFAELNSVEFVQYVYVWDSVTVCLSSDLTEAKTGDTITFTFNSVPNSGFMYSITLDDGSAALENTEAVLSSAYSAPSLSHVYTTPGVFLVTMAAWNPFYVSICDFTITVQVPIPTMILTPASDTIPYPDGLVTFDFSMAVNGPSPTNVTCDFDFDDTNEMNQSTEIIFGNSISKPITYTSAAVKAVNFTCWNLVSTETQLASIDVKTWSLSDFMVTHLSKASSNMTATPNNMGYLVPVSEATEVTFNISLLGCSRPPPGIEFVWNFGDQTPTVTQSVTNWDLITHTYVNRGTYQIVVDMTSLTPSNTYSLPPQSIQIGIGVLTASVYAGTVGTSVTFTVSGLDSAADITIYANGNTFPSPNALTGQATTTYNSWGSYLPYAIITNSDEMEKVYLDKPYTADNPLDLGLEFSNLTIPLPPGILTMNVTTSGVDLPMVVCNINYGDAIDNSWHQFVHNITSNSPMELNITYLTLGEHVLQVNCSNFLDNFYNATDLVARNPCFTWNGMFIFDYADPLTPMKAYTSVDTDLANGMAVVCYWLNPTYQWTISKWTNGIPVPIDYVSTLNPPPTGTIRFGAGKLSPGVYQCCLNVSLEDTFAFECTNIGLERPAPFAYIVGGAGRSAKRTITVVDGYTDTYDQEGGYGARDGLNYSISCFRFNETTDWVLNQFEVDGGITFFSNDSLDRNGTLFDDVNVCESFVQISTGKMQLDATSNDFMSYFFIMRVDLDQAESSYVTQVMEVKDGDFPLADIICLINCRIKVARSLKTSMKCKCTDCTPEEIPNLTCSWTLNTVFPNGSSVAVPDFQSMTETGTSDHSLVIKPESLEAGLVYNIVVKMSLPNRVKDGEAVRVLKVNLPPYGGSCAVDPLEGYAITGKFDVTCSNMKDEGANDERDPIEDTKQVLVYEFIAIHKRLVSGVPTTVEFPITKGNAAAANQLDLQVGDPDFDYNVTIAVRVTDYYGDSVVNMDSVAKVLRNESMVPSGPNDTSIISDLFSTFNQSRQQLEAGGNKIAVVSAVSAMGSFISSIDSSQGGLVTDMLTEKNQELMTMLNNAVPNGTVLSVSDTDNILGGVKTLLSNSDIVSDETIGSAINTAQKLSASLDAKISQKPFPMEDVNSMRSVSESLLDIVSSTSMGITPSTVVDPNADITLESVRAEMEAKWDYNNTSEALSDEELAERERMIQDEYESRIAAQAETKEKAVTAQTGIPELFDIIESVQALLAAMIQPGEPASVIKRDNCIITTEKTRLENLLNQTSLNKTDFDIDFGNSTLDGYTEVQIDTSVFDDTIHFYGANADGLTSGEYTVSIKDENGTEMALDTKLKIKNKGPGVPFAQYMPMVSEDGLTHIVYDLRYRDDAALIYILPKDFSFADVSSFNLYTVYVRCIDFARNDIYDYKVAMNVRDWEGQYGFKVFIPQDLCDEGKTYVGLEPQEEFILPPQSNRMRRRRSAPATNNTDAPFEMSTANFSILIMTTGCRSWDKANSRWTSKGCTVLSMSTLNETVCRCPEAPGNTFSTTFYVPPNMIDFSTVWSKFDPANASVYGTVIGLLVVYIIACVIANREDRKDYLRWATHFLCDSDSEDRYFYLLTVHTGLRRGAGTKSMVNFVLAGEEMDTGVRIMSDGDKQGFETSSVRKFFMGTPEPLGDLTYLRIWHDSSGRGDQKSWYLHKVTVDDPQIGQRYVFLCDKWLAAEQDDGMVERLLPVCGRDNLLTFDKLFSQHARFNLTENHLWLSMLMRPEMSSFTRVQRLSCILALLFLTMISNAMFFRSESDQVTPNSVSLGFLRFSLTTVYVSFIGIIITTPPILLVTYIFKKAKPTFPKTKKIDPKKEKELRNIFQTKTIINQNEHFSDSQFYSVDHLPLPAWSRYIAITIVFLAVISSAFFLILYSMEWGKDKSEEWLTTFVFSFVESLLVVDPFKVIMIAVLFALLFKKPVDGGGPQLKMDKLRDAAKTFNAGSSRTYLSFRMDVLSSNSPPSAEMLEKTRIQRLHEMKAREVFLELLLYGIFAFVIYSISFVNRDQRSYNLKTNIYDSLVAPSKTHLGFSKVENQTDFIDWMNSTFFQRYFPQTEYNGDSLDIRDELFFWDLANTRIGPPRLRQVRMKRGGCPYDKVTPGRDCIPAYDVTTEEDNDYCVGWTQDVASAGCTSPFLFSQEAWRYQHSEDIWGVAIAGNFDVYGGGGYILKLENDLTKAELILDELQRFKWINRETRAVFVEFTLYNANANLFAYVIFLAEFTELGGLVTWSNIYPFRAYQHTGALGTFAMLCYFIYMIVMIYGCVKLVMKFRKAGCCQFFKDVWNVIDTLCVLLSFVGVVMWGLRYSYATQSLAIYYDDPRAFINFQHVVIYDIVFNVIVGILVFIATIRILRILGYNKRMTQLAAVISNAASDLCGFAVVFGIVFFAYVSFGYLLFGIYIYEYRNLFTSLGSLANALIGKNSLDSMIRAVPNWSQMYYFTYVFFVILTLMTMFAVILNQSISEVRADLMKTPQTYGIMDVLGSSVKDILGMAFKFKNKDEPEKENKHRNKEKAEGETKPRIHACCREKATGDRCPQHSPSS